MDADRETVEGHVRRIADENDLRDETADLAVEALDVADPGEIADEPFTTAAAALYAGALIANDTITVHQIARDAGIQPDIVRDRSLMMIEYLE